MSEEDIQEFRASGKFDAARAEIMATYKQSQAKAALEAAIAQHVDRQIQTNPDLLRGDPRDRLKTVYTQVRQGMAMATIDGTAATNEFLDRELRRLEETLTAEWVWPKIE